MKLSSLIKLPEKKTYHEEVSSMSEIENELLRSLDNGYNLALSDLANMEIEVDEEAIWKMLSEVYGCKSNKEDCRFNRCDGFSRCTILAHAIASQLPKIMKRKD